MSRRTRFEVLSRFTTDDAGVLHIVPAPVKPVHLDIYVDPSRVMNTPWRNLRQRFAPAVVSEIPGFNRNERIQKPNCSTPDNPRSVNLWGNTP